MEESIYEVGGYEKIVSRNSRIVSERPKISIQTSYVCEEKRSKRQVT